MNSISANDIKEQLQEAYDCKARSKLEILLMHYAADERPGVARVLEHFANLIQKDDAENERLNKLSQYERHYVETAGFRFICGIDEAGRGPLAGPVVAGAVILPPGAKIPGVNDSKKLSAAKREALFDVITEQAVATGIGMAGPERIDEINILQATYEAMRQAVADLKDKDGRQVTPEILLNDAVTIPGIEIPQIPIVHGDGLSISIAAASILAKVTRDRIMTEYDAIFPEYGFAGHKGYGSAAHMEAIKKYGPSVIHRRTFLTRI